jgi:glycosyltransferase involved in cell wall biosynthesis
MIKVASITGDKNQPSSRFRIRQYIEELKLREIEIEDYCSINGKYPPRGLVYRLIWGIKVLIERYLQVLKINQKNYDCVFLQREMISTLYTFEFLIKHPVIFDVDDAIFLRKEGKFAEKIARKSNAVICGNSYLASRFKQWNDNVFILPTAVDSDRFRPEKNKNKENEVITIGWIGTSSGFKYLYSIEMALKKILNENLKTELLIVSNERPNFNYIEKFEFIKWTAEHEVCNFQKIDIGLMPLEDDEWTKGKCSFKMLQHMSCGTPVVVSEVGMNIEVLSQGRVGFGASNYFEDWVTALNELINDDNLRFEIGKNGRKVVEEYYSLKVLSNELVAIINKTLRGVKK